MSAETYSDQIRQRLLNKEELEKRGFKPYGSRFDKEYTIGEIIYKFSQGTESGKKVKVAGRIIAKRIHGKATFVDMCDFSGKIQLYFKLDVLGSELYELFDYLDVGDIIGVEGYIFRTHKGELTIMVEDFTPLSKCLRPLPEKWHGLKDIEIRYRQRYLDLLVNPSVKELFILRTKIISKIRQFLDERGFIEVETPVMSTIAGGAEARPFITYHNTLNMNLYLRIATELYLKRLVVGGLEKVYEIGKVFRNEGISAKHNPEFTMLELYQAYADYEDMMNIVEELLEYLVKELFGRYTISYGNETINFKPPYPRISFESSLKKYGNIELKKLYDFNCCREIASQYGIAIDKHTDIAHLIDKIFENVVEPHLRQPTFIIDYPIELSPLAKRKEDSPDLTYRFELFILHSEIANAFSELNDPLDQKERFLKQMEKRKRGDEEAHMMDEDYINALEYGLPPTGGLGIGIDRLTMLLSNTGSIRDVILFPLLRPQQ